MVAFYPSVPFEKGFTFDWSASEIMLRDRKGKVSELSLLFRISKHFNHLSSYPPEVHLCGQNYTMYVAT